MIIYQVLCYIPVSLSLFVISDSLASFKSSKISSFVTVTSSTFSSSTVLISSSSLSEELLEELELASLFSCISVSSGTTFTSAWINDASVFVSTSSLHFSSRTSSISSIFSSSLLGAEIISISSLFVASGSFLSFSDSSSEEELDESTSFSAASSFVASGVATLSDICPKSHATNVG